MNLIINNGPFSFCLMMFVAAVIARFIPARVICSPASEHFEDEVSYWRRFCECAAALMVVGMILFGVLIEL